MKMLLRGWYWWCESNWLLNSLLVVVLSLVGMVTVWTRLESMTPSLTTFFIFGPKPRLVIR